MRGGHAQGPANPQARKIQETLERLGYANRVLELSESARSVAEAARAIGCEPGQVVKCMVFRGERSGRPVLVAASGPNRVNEGSIEALLGEPVGRPDADFVRRKTGFAIGGVPPVGHREEPAAFVDEDLLGYGEVFASAGTHNAIFGLTPEELVRMTAGRVAPVKV